jgi:capsular polysaccharide biosynthesis protein
MEPNLEELDDYNKPLKPNKMKWIVIAFVIAIAVYAGYVLLMESFS